jgi:monomeric sarcosine oxidase
MTMATFDAIVLGAGAMGSAAAYYLAKAGQRVLLLEQFEIGHRRGSSHGATRIIRYAYNDPRYVQLARATYPLWFELEQAAGETLYIKTGGLDFGQPDEPSLRDTIQAMQDSGVVHEVLSADEANRRFPQFRFQAGMIAIYQPDSGLLAAARCVRAHLRLAERHGAVIRERTPVIAIDIQRDSVTVTTGDERFSAGRLVITAGAWAGRLLAGLGVELPLEPRRCQPAHFHPSGDDPARYNVGRMPVFIYHREGDLHHAIYGLPDYEGSGVKTAFFYYGEPLRHPDEVDYTPDPAEVERIREQARRFLPAVGAGALVETHVCLYTMTPDSHFVVDHLPGYAHVVIGAGFSGHGFKFSTGIGSILCDLALRGETLHDLSLFRLTRFRR